MLYGSIREKGELQYLECIILSEDDQKLSFFMTLIAVLVAFPLFVWSKFTI